MVEIDILIEDDRWAALGLDALAEEAVTAALAGAGIKPGSDVSILACDDARIAALNEQFRGKPTPTNVLSWPAEDLSPAIDGARPLPPQVPELGDIAISYDTCAREAAETGKKLPDHVTHLIIHGVLHLLGYDHETDKEATLMEELEIKTLETLGIHNPY